MAGLGGLSGPVGILPFSLVCLCFVSDGRKEARASF